MNIDCCHHLIKDVRRGLNSGVKIHFGLYFCFELGGLHKPIESKTGFQC